MSAHEPRPLMSTARDRHSSRLFIALVVLLSLILTGCVGSGTGVVGSGKLKTETRSVSGFQGVTLDGIGDVDLRIGPTASLTVEAEENILPYLITEVVGEQLVISTKPLTVLQTTQPIRYTVTATDLKKVEINGSGNVVLHDLAAQDLELTLNGSGDLTADGSVERLKVDTSGSGDVALYKLTAQDLEVTTSGSGDITASGTAERFTATLAGSGMLQAAELKASVAKVSATGSGDATVWATDSLEASTMGSGDIIYYGEPKVTVDSTGSGDVKSGGKK